MSGRPQPWGYKWETLAAVRGWGGNRDDQRRGEKEYSHRTVHNVSCNWVTALSTEGRDSNDEYSTAKT